MKRKARLFECVGAANAWLETNCDVNVIDIRVATATSSCIPESGVARTTYSTVISIIYEAKE
jgi:hypothetical protein